MYWIAVLVPPVAVFLSTERMRSRIATVALTLLWAFGLSMIMTQGGDEVEAGQVIGLLLLLPSIIHAVLTVRDARRKGA